MGIGNGVWAGSISHSSMAEPLAKGYATVATDTGHVGIDMDAKWAIGHHEKLINFEYRAVHEMTVKAKEILKVYYGKKEDRSYWASCSTGGRQGLIEAYRFPQDYDGISSMAPGKNRYHGPSAPILRLLYIKDQEVLMMQIILNADKMDYKITKKLKTVKCHY